MSFRRLTCFLAGAALALSSAVTLVGAQDAPEKRSAEAVPQTPAPPPAPDPPERWPSQEARVGIGDDITIAKGERHRNDVVCIRGRVTIDGEVDGDVVVVAGRIELNGTVRGSVIAVATSTRLGDDAVIEGDLTNVGGSLHRGDGTIRGGVVNISPFDMSFPGFGGGWNIFGSFFDWWKVFQLFLFFIAALLLAALVPERIRIISEETPIRLFTAFLFGLIGYMLLVLTLFVLVVTLVGIPLVPFVYFAFVILKWMAMCGVFHYVGTRLARTLGREMSFLGAVLLGFAPFALIRLVPTFCLGYFVWFLVEIVAFGFLIVTRVGTRPSASFAAPPATLAPPAPPLTG